MKGRFGGLRLVTFCCYNITLIGRHTHLLIFKGWEQFDLYRWRMQNLFQKSGAAREVFRHRFHDLS